MKAGTEDIVVRADMRLLDIQGAFSARYPFLMIEFFQKEKGGLTHKHVQLNSSTLLSELCRLNATQAIDIQSGRIVSAVLQDFMAALGLIVGMCRKSGNVWNAITLTDGWTLERQNTAGAYISSIMRDEGALSLS